MDSSTSKELRSSADYSDYSFGAEQALIDGTPILRSYSSRLKNVYQRYGAFIIVQLLLLALYAGFFLMKRNTIFVHSRQSIVYSPAEDAIKYEKLRFNATLVINSPYNGPPGQDVDKAWSNLLHNMNMALPGSDLRRLGTTSIPVPDRDDTYIAGLGVFHELHCLKRLRQYTWRDHYFPNITADEERLNRLHNDHYIDVLRQGIMCHADISLFTLQWSRDSLPPRADFSGEHECRNWDAINEWAGKHRVDLTVPGFLVHPYRGVAFPDGKGSIIGASEDHSPTVT